jgi:hypothetical protein
MTLPEDIVSKVRQNFSEDDSLLVLLRLKELSGENPERFDERILRCLVFVAGDKAEKIDSLANEDPRDLIVAAEYEWGDRARHLQFPFGFHPEIKIVKSWFVGQKILVPWAENQIWVVDKSDIRSFSIEQVHPLKEAIKTVLDPNLYFIYASFLLIRGENEISASNAIEGEAVFRYRSHPETGAFEFIEFRCNNKKLGKRGKW